MHFCLSAFDLAVSAFQYTASSREYALFPGCRKEDPEGRVHGAWPPPSSSAEEPSLVGSSSVSAPFRTFRRRSSFLCPAAAAVLRRGYDERRARMMITAILAFMTIYANFFSSSERPKKGQFIAGNMINPLSTGSCLQRTLANWNSHYFRWI